MEIKVPVERITGKIFLIRKGKVMLDSDLAEPRMVYKRKYLYNP